MSSQNNTMTLHRVVITGMGAVSPAGLGVETLWSKVTSGECCLSLFPEERREQLGVNVGGSIPNYDPLEVGFTKKESRRFAPFVQYAILASDEAMAQAGIDMEAEDADRFACVFGSGIGGLNMFEHESDAALAGGSEEGTANMSLAGFANLGAVTKSDDPKNASMPFDVRRNGFVPGEGAGAVVLESLEHAQARGANIIAEVTGFGSTGDAYHITAPEPSGEGAVRAMKQALAEGGFSVDDIGHLNAHGTATPVNDKTESAAWNALLGDRAAKIPVTSVKGCVGHMLGAAGAIEAIVAALSAARSVVPPTAGFAEADPECPVLVPTAAMVNYEQKVVLSNSLGFGGHNATLALSPFVEERA